MQLEAFKTAQQIEGSPHYLKDLIQKFEKPGGQYEVGSEADRFPDRGCDRSCSQRKAGPPSRSLKVSYFLFEMDKSFVKSRNSPQPILGEGLFPSILTEK